MLKKLADLEANIILLFVGLMFFAGVLLITEFFFKDDAQIFQVIAGILTGFASALFALLTKKEPGQPPANQAPKP